METITREEQFLNAVAEGTPPNIKPVTREELFLAKAAGQDVKVPTPITRKEMFLKQVAENAGGGGGGGGGGGEADHTVEDGLITGTLTEYTNDRVTGLGGLTFASNKNIVSVSFSNVTSVKKEMFNGATNLKSASFPSARGCGASAFNNCKALTSVNIPSLLSLGGTDFYDCISLVEITLPNYDRSMSGNNFKNCTALKKVDLGSSGLAQSNANFISASMFENCPVFDTLIIRHTANMRVLVNVSAFKGTPFAEGGTGGIVYVPQALLESYQTATNWSTLYAAGTCTFLPLEEYTLDGTTTGEVDMAKVEAKLNELYGGAG